MNLKGVINKEAREASNNKDDNKKPERENSKIGPVLAELGNAPGTVKMMLVSPKAVEEKSIDSINCAMLLIKEISTKVGNTVEEMPVERRPSKVQMAFNLRLTTDGRAVITKSEKETNLKVTLMWSHAEKDKEKEFPEGLI